MQKHRSKHKSKPDFKPMQRRFAETSVVVKTKSSKMRQQANLLSFIAIGGINLVAGPDGMIKSSAACLSLAAFLSVVQQNTQTATQLAQKPNYLTCAIMMSSLASNALSIASFINTMVQDHPQITPVGAASLAFASLALSPAANFNGLLDQKPNAQTIKPEVYSALFFLSGAAVLIGGYAENSPRLMTIGALCLVNAFTGDPKTKEILHPQTLMTALNVMAKTPYRISNALITQTNPVFAP